MPRANPKAEPVPEHFTKDMLDVIKAGLGLHYKRVPYKNRLDFNIGREGIVTAAQCEGWGLLVQDYAEHYGKMRVFRVTGAGFQAAGILRPKADLLALATRAAESHPDASAPALPLTA